MDSSFIPFCLFHSLIVRTSVNDLADNVEMIEQMQLSK